MSHIMYFAIPKECEQELLMWLPGYKGVVEERVVIAECVVLTLKGYDHMYAAFRDWAMDKGWPYNITKHHDDVGYWFNTSFTCRYDAFGEVHTQQNVNPGHPEIREVLHSMVQLSHNNPRDKDRIFHAYLLNTEWDHQLQYGKLAVMRKLLGAD